MWIKELIFYEKNYIYFSHFFFDRATKIYLINLQSSGTDVDFYIFPFLNLYLTWNTGIGFGLASLDANMFYHALTVIILIINIILLFFCCKKQRVFMFTYLRL